MENSPGLMFFVISTAASGFSAVVVWLVRRNDRLEQRIESTNKEAMDALKVSAELGKKVPEMTVQLQQSSDENRMLRDENRELRQRITDLERRS